MQLNDLTYVRWEMLATASLVTFRELQQKQREIFPRDENF